MSHTFGSKISSREHRVQNAIHKKRFNQKNWKNFANKPQQSLCERTFGEMRTPHKQG
jgi:hypothetical protein